MPTDHSVRSVNSHLTKLTIATSGVLGTLSRAPVDALIRTSYSTVNNLDRIKLGISNWESALAHDDPHAILPPLRELKARIEQTELEHPEYSAERILAESTDSELDARIAQRFETMRSDTLKSISHMKDSLNRIKQSQSDSSMLGMMASEIHQRIEDWESSKLGLEDSNFFKELKEHVGKFGLVADENTRQIRAMTDKSWRDVRRAHLRISLSSVLSSFCGAMIYQYICHSKNVDFSFPVISSVLIGVAMYVHLSLKTKRAVEKAVAEAKATAQNNI